MQCPKCQKDIDETRFKGLAFCPYCGASTTKEKKAQRLAFCPYCGKELKEATPFCSQCGKELPEDAATEEGEAAEATTQHHDILTESKEFLGHTADLIKRNIGKERKVRKLYEQWAEHADLPEGELANIEAEAHRAPKSRYLHEEEVNYDTLSRRRQQQMPILYILLALAVLIIITGIILLVSGVL